MSQPTPPLLPGERKRVSTTTRWVAVCAVLVLALAVAIWPTVKPQTNTAQQPSVAPTANADEVAKARSAAGLAPCDQVGPTRGPLAGVRLECLGDGAPVDAGALPSGLPTLVNVWAWWCGPCRVELPALSDLAHRGAGKLTVLSVHADPNAAAALDLLAELGVRTPAVQDAQSRVATALGAPRVYPATILLRADGTVAGVHARPFTSVDEVVGVVRSDLGVEL